MALRGTFHNTLQCVTLFHVMTCIGSRCETGFAKARKVWPHAMIVCVCLCVTLFPRRLSTVNVPRGPGPTMEVPQGSASLLICHLLIFRWCCYCWERENSWRWKANRFENYSWCPASQESSMRCSVLGTRKPPSTVSNGKTRSGRELIVTEGHVLCHSKFFFKAFYQKR